LAKHDYLLMLFEFIMRIKALNTCLQLKINYSEKKVVSRILNRNPYLKFETGKYAAS